MSEMPSPAARASVARVAVPLGSRSYDVLIGEGLLDDPATLAPLAGGQNAVLVTNDVVAPILGERAKRALQRRFRQVSIVTLPDGEQSKRWEVLNTVFDAVIEARCDRSSTLVALGGGVVGDITGFAAACFMRGIAHVQIPTTLLSQVDSSVGGKTAINHPAGKNMIGAFHQPALVVADVGLLDTLPEREFVSGLAEVIKYGAIADDEFLSWLEAHMAALLARDKPALIHAVRRSCEIKAAIVASDELESGRRALLNFGHTFGHSFEAARGYGTWLHGEAVGCGMVLAARLSARLGLITSARAGRIESIVRRAGLPSQAPAIPSRVLLEWMTHDKKVEAGQQRHVLLEAATGATVRPVDPALVAGIIDESQSA
jgi:3-dehydroquinate synthase